MEAGRSLPGILSGRGGGVRERGQAGRGLLHGGGEVPLLEGAGEFSSRARTAEGSLGVAAGDGAVNHVPCAEETEVFDVDREVGKPKDVEEVHHGVGDNLNHLLLLGECIKHNAKVNQVTMYSEITKP